MFPHFEERLSDSPLVERIWSTQSDRAGSFTSISTVFWSMVIAKCNGRISISLHGPETAATGKEFPAEAEWFGIAFKQGTFVPHIPPGSFIDNMFLPDVLGRSFSLLILHGNFRIMKMPIPLSIGWCVQVFSCMSPS